MSLTSDVLSAGTRTEVRGLLASVSVDERRSAVLSLANEVLQQLRRDAHRAHEVAVRATIVAPGEDGATDARARWVLGHAQAALVRSEEAIESYRIAADLYGRLGMRSERARVGIGLVNALTYAERYEDALEAGAATRRDLMRTKQQAAAARLDVNLGNLHDRTESPLGALKCYDRALRLATRVVPDDRAMHSMIRFNRGSALLGLGRYVEAERAFQRAADESEASGDRRIQALAISNLGYLFLQRGDYAEAWRLLDEAREAFREIGDEHWHALTLLDLVELLFEVGNYSRLDSLARDAEQQSDALGLQFERARAVLFRALARLGSEDGFGARELLGRAHASFREQGQGVSSGVCDIYLADLDLAEGDSDSAVSRLRAAIRGLRADSHAALEAAARLSLATALAEKRRWAPADAEVEAAGRLLRKVASPWLRVRRWHVAGQIAARRGEPDTAIRNYRRAARALEKNQGRLAIDDFRVSMAEAKADVWADLIEAVMERGARNAVSDAFALVERARSRALVDLLAGGLPDESTGDPRVVSLLRQLDRLRARLNDLRGFDRSRRSAHRAESASTSAARACEAEIAETLLRLEDRSASMGALTRGETDSLESAQRDLPEDTELVEFFVGERATWALVVTKDAARAVRLPAGRAELARRVERLRFQIEKCCHGEEYVRARLPMLLEGTTQHLRGLADTIWAPLELSAPRVVLVPHASLHGVPFAALPTRDGVAVDHHRLSHLPSASCRRYTRRRRGLERSDARVLALEAGGEDLPAARREVEAVRRSFGRGQLLRGSRATFERFREAAPKADVIHLATHGLFRPEDAAFSSILLADGWVGMHDLYGLRLSADLVCLSACQTGRSWLDSGEEMVGLVRGLFHAGASAVLVSLWPVDDDSTAELMAAFYRRVRTGIALDEALATATREVRRSRQHPFYWAPFVLVGSPE